MTGRTAHSFGRPNFFTEPDRTIAGGCLEKLSTLLLENTKCYISSFVHVESPSLSCWAVGMRCGCRAKEVHEVPVAWPGWSPCTAMKVDSRQYQQEGTVSVC